MRKGFNWKLMQQCGNLKSEDKTYREIQREIGHIGYKTVRRYCKMHTQFMTQVRNQYWAMMKQAVVQAGLISQPMQEVLVA